MPNETHIRVRASIAIVQNERILLTPHFLDDGSTKWHMPGGGVDFGETLRAAAERELHEETGYIGKAGDLIDLREVIQPEIPYHGIGLTFSDIIIGGDLRAENHHIYGLKQAQWLTKNDLHSKIYDRPEIINRLLGIDP